MGSKTVFVLALIKMENFLKTVLTFLPCSVIIGKQ